MRNHTTNRRYFVAVLTLSFVSFGQLSVAQQKPGAHVDLPSSKQLLLPLPGSPQRLNSLPMSMAVSPDRRWVLTINAGYGTLESGYQQSVSVLDTTTGKVQDFPDSRTLIEAKQTFFSGLAFSADGKHVYGSLGSSSDPEGAGKGDTGSGIVVWSFDAGALKAERFIKLPLVTLAAGRHTLIREADGGTKGVPYPAAIAVIPHGADATEKLLVAENLSDTVAIVDVATGKVERRVDLANQPVVPSLYPIALAVSHDGSRAFVALWNASEVVELNVASGTVTRQVALMQPKSPTLPGTHPCDLLLDERSGLLYAALSNRDAVAAIEIGTKAAPRLTVRGYFDTRLPRQTYFGAEPNALASNADGSRLYAANMGTNSVAVLDPRKLKSMAKAKGLVEPLGFLPTELMPMAMASSGGKLYVATGKGQGTGPNARPQIMTENTKGMKRFARPFTYAPTLLYGSLATFDEAAMEADLAQMTAQVVESNRMRAGDETIAFAAGHNPIKHVIYIIKENRTYDQVLGDLALDGKPVGNGDPSLTMYGAAITPNQHKLALQFGVLDNFFDSGEVSGEGHVWSTAGIGTDYLEKTWQQNYRGNNRTYDYEGMVADGYPLLQHIPDVNEPASSYLWTNVAAHGKTLLHFGEYISTSFCTDKKSTRKLMNPQEGAMAGDESVCAHPAYKPGEALPAEWGGGTNLWPWEIPRIASNTATKPELVGHFAPESPDFNLRVPDQIRVQIFLKHLDQWKRDREAGQDTMPDFVMLRLPNDHTGGTVAGGPTPKSSRCGQRPCDRPCSRGDFALGVLG